MPPALQCPRTVYFTEIEAWLRELVWWEEELKDAGGTKGGGIVLFSGSPGGFKGGSALEREAIYMAEIRTRVVLLRDMISQFSTPIQEFIQVAYLARTATMGHAVKPTCDLLGITRTEYFEIRERVLLPILAELCWRRIDPGKPFSHCEIRAGRGEYVPKSQRSTE